MVNNSTVDDLAQSLVNTNGGGDGSPLLLANSRRLEKAPFQARSSENHRLAVTPYVAS